MDYWFDCVTPPNTPKEEAVETEMKVTEGIITHVWIMHPPGCHGVAHAKIFDGIHQLYPTNPAEDYRGSGFPMEFDDAYEVKEPSKLWLVTWNDSVSYPHAVYVRVTIQPKAYAMPWLIVKDLVDILKRLIGI